MFEKKEGELESGMQGLTIGQSSSSSSSGITVSDLSLTYNSALVAFQKGELETATEQLKEILKSNPESAQANSLLGEVCFSRKDLPAAMMFLETAISLDNNNATAHFILGKIHFDRKNLFLAAQHLRSASFIDPKNVETHRLLGEVHKLTASVSKDLGDDTEVEENFLKAEKAFDNALVQDPNDTQALFALQNLRYDHGKLPFNEVFAAQKGDIWKTLIALNIHNNLPLVKRVIKEKVQHPFKAYDNKVDGKNEQGWTPLQICTGSLVLVQLLVEDYKADVRIIGRDGGTALTVAASLGKTEVIQYLVSKGAMLGTYDAKGENILHTCVRDHLPEEGNPRNLTTTIRAISVILREQDQPLRAQHQDPFSFQISLVENDGKKEPIGTTLLLQLLTRKNRNNQTVIQLADSLGKSWLAGLFRQELALLINERLSGLTNCLMTPLENNTFRPIFLADPKAILRLSPVYSAFLTTHLSCLPGSFFCSNAPAYTWLCVVHERAGSMITVTPEVAKLRNIAEIHINAAFATDAFAQTILSHGLISASTMGSLVTSHITATLRELLPSSLRTVRLSAAQREVANQHDVPSVIASYAEQPVTTPPFLLIYPQPIIDRLKESIFSHYQSIFANKIRTYCSGEELEDSNDDIYGYYQNIVHAIKDLKSTDFTASYQYIKPHLTIFCKLLNEEIRKYTQQIKKGLKLADNEDETYAVLQKLDTIFKNNLRDNITVPSYRSLTEIFEELTGIQVQVKSSNFGWVAALEETRKKHAVSLPEPSLGS